MNTKSDTNTYTTYEIAEYMLRSGKAYTSTQLAKELGVPYDIMTGKFHNIRSCKKYKTQESNTKPISLTVLDIDGYSKKQYLWHKLHSAF